MSASMKLDQFSMGLYATEALASECPPSRDHPTKCTLQFALAECYLVTSLFNYKKLLPLIISIPYMKFLTEC